MTKNKIIRHFILELITQLIQINETVIRHHPVSLYIYFNTSANSKYICPGVSRDLPYILCYYKLQYMS